MGDPSKVAFLLERAKGLPDQPGVYVMKDPNGRILYVGKAKKLSHRVRSYFQNQDRLPGRTRVLVNKIHDLEFTVTHNELEALLLECNLIKKHRPRYNVRLKDDKNYPYVVLDFTHPFPQFRITRKVVASPKLRYFGPYSAGVHEIGRFLLKTFQIRDCSDIKFNNRTRPCLNYEIGICTAPCVAYVSQEDYGKQVRDAVLFLKGKKRVLLHNLKKEMNEASKRTRYEVARVIRDKIFAIEKLTEKQQAVLTDNLKDIDVIGSYESKGEIQWVVLFVRSGFLTGRRVQKTGLGLGTSEDSLRTFLEQFYTVSLVPDEVWIKEDFADRATLEKFLAARAGKKAHIRVRRTEKGMRLLGMAQQNAKLIFEEGNKRQAGSASEELKKVLGLAETPTSIEGIDVSNLQGTNPTASVVHFADERPFKGKYRLFHPRTVEGQDDFAMIYEVCLRRYSNPENPPPDLILIDGGKGQLASAVKALGELKLDVPVCSLAKARTESGFTLKGIERSEERIFIPNRKNPIVLREGNPALALLQQVRDEAHRFALKNQRARRKKTALEVSELTAIEGVGPKTRKKLLETFGSLEAIRRAGVEDLIKSGVARRIAERLVAVREPNVETEE